MSAPAAKTSQYDDGQPGEFAVIIQSLPNAEFKVRLLQRDGYPMCVCAMNNQQKMRVALAVGQILRVDASDYERSEKGTGDIIEVVHEPKEIKRLRKAGAIPSEEDMPHIPTKEHHHDKRDKRHHGERAAANDDDVEARNQQHIGAQREPCFDDEHGSAGDDDGDEEQKEHLEPLEEGKGKRLSKADKKALKKEAQEIIPRDSKRVTKALEATGCNENLDDL